MKRHDLHNMICICSILLLSLATLITDPASVSGQDNRCEILRSHLAQKNVRLTEYMNTVKKLHDRDDGEIIHAINSKMAELRDQIIGLEKELRECEDIKGKKEPATPDGLSPAQSEEGEEATKTCGELRKRLVALVKTLHYLRRRDSSLLSRVTDAERKQLQETTSELKAVREALRNRCSIQPNSKVSRQASPGK